MNIFNRNLSLNFLEKNTEDILSMLFYMKINPLMKQSSRYQMT